MKKVSLIIAFFCSVLLAVAAGVPQVRNFSRNDYHAAPQNWALACDALGRICIGNGYCMTVFDGLRWSKFGLPNSTAVRSLFFDETSGRLYAAGTEELGYYTISDNAVPEYTSLMSLFDTERPPFTEIWNIFTTPGHVWFQSDYHLIDYNGENAAIHRADERISTSAAIDGNILLALDDGRIQTYRNNKFTTIPHSSALRGNKIVELLKAPEGDGLLVVTADNGTFEITPDSFRPLHSDINEFLRENQAFCAIANDSIYVFGTVNKGAVIKNFKTNETSYLNKDTGLQNNTVLNAGFDAKGNVWLCLDNGVSLILTTSPIRNLLSSDDAIGAGYCSLQYGNRLLLGTNQGLYSVPYPISLTTSIPDIKRELKGQIWSITRDGNYLFIGSDTGLYIANGDTFERIAGPGGTYMATIINKEATRAIASTYNGFHLLKYVANRWTDGGRIHGYDDIGGHFIISDNHIWLAHWRKGIYQLQLSADGNYFTECKLFDSKSGLPSNNYNNVTAYNNRILASTNSGFYEFDYESNRFIRNDYFNQIYGNIPNAIVTGAGDGTILLSSEAILKFAHNRGSETVVDSISLFPLKDKIIPGFIDVDYLTPNELVISNQEGFWLINPQNIKPQTQNTPFVSAVYANGDSLIYYADFANKPTPELKMPHSIGSLKFNFGSTNFGSLKSMEFSSKLDGYDDDYSSFSNETSREYTQLSEGKYTLHLRMRNDFGEILETTFPLTVTPPWYRSLWAKIIYLLIFALLIYGLYRMIVSRIRASRQRLEQRKDYEIAALKSEQLEQDIKHKSEELSATTMSLIRKNEILREIASQIENLTPGDTTALRRQLDKLQKHIADSIDHDDDQKEFIRNFDIVYQDYTKRLLERHPSLTAADKRMCCYIKMGLSSKEIAPLINISFKSVEMARYRLRKKMNLPADTSLTDYLTSI